MRDTFAKAPRIDTRAYDGAGVSIAATIVDDVEYKLVATVEGYVAAVAVWPNGKRKLFRLDDRDEE